MIFFFIDIFNLKIYIIYIFIYINICEFYWKFMIFTRNKIAIFRVTHMLVVDGETSVSTVKPSKEFIYTYPDLLVVSKIIRFAIYWNCRAKAAVVCLLDICKFHILLESGKDSSPIKPFTFLTCLMRNIFQSINEQADSDLSHDTTYVHMYIDVFDSMIFCQHHFACKIDF